MAVLALLLAARTVAAAEIAGITLPPSETVNGTRLELAACAVREELWTNLYVVSLYTPGAIAGAAVMAGDQNPRLVRLDVTYTGEVPDGLPEAWRTRLQQRIASEFIRTLKNQYDKLRQGDTVRLAFIPGRGTTLSVNGREVASSKDSTLMDEIADIWTGPDAISANIKRTLLRGGC